MGLYLLALAIALPFAKQSPCEIRLVSARTCDENGQVTTPTAGDDYYNLKITWNVLGTPDKPYRLRATMADQELFLTPEFKGPGQYSYIVRFIGALDGPIDVSVTIDPDNVSGDTTPKDNTGSFSISPIPPASAIQYYAPKKIKVAIHTTLNWSGTRPYSYYYLSEPTSEGSQTVLEWAPLPGFVRMHAEPSGQPLHAILIDKPQSPLEFDEGVTIEARSVRVNRKLLDAVSWRELSNLPAQVRCHLGSEPNVLPQAPEIQRFVKDSLPDDFRSKMTPAQVARALFLAVAKSLTYHLPPVENPRTVLKTGQAACGGMTNVYISCLRSVGVPARSNKGFVNHPSRGELVGHAWSEFYLPGIGWIPEDVTDCNSMHPKGDNAYFFGHMPELNGRLICQRCDSYAVPKYTITSAISLTCLDFVMSSNDKTTRVDKITFTPID
ncbi:transglutaminase-like domain-containing protein [Fimbriimonas ginsengisoli]|uniref:Transglutaminase-like domain-containing protein n=1 Tax=Fimbriimonas ginsengisoli Gsoil 348 TaxID=661478 RepID=A0A068NSW5_FIMGI|nr:transglutaminase domain-containing protein [Fimbriimonas ginsengisoli]AIE84714.1 hypothetical protein OP10G_1346 [Fimbriimonas ginsengisoli Gsoil 348]